MLPSTAQAMESSTLAARLTRTKKLEFLASLTEDEFRDRVVCPIFHRRGMSFTRDTCGSDEQGKDCICTTTDPLGRTVVYVIQTKRGDVTMSRKPTQNVLECVTQLRTALETQVVLNDNLTKRRPDYAVLCTSGELSNSARAHIQDTLSDPRLIFIDANTLIPDIDYYYPEFWYGVDPVRFPYLRSLRTHLFRASDTIALNELGITESGFSPIADDSYITLYVSRIKTRRYTVLGEIRQEPFVVEFPVQRLLEEPERLVLVLGEGGAGKTTALRRLAVQLADRVLSTKHSGPIPVIVRAADILASPSRLSETVALIAQQMAGTSGSCFSDTDLSSGNVAVLVDALDEVRQDDRNLVLSRIADFHQQFRKCLVILTSRDYAAITNLPLLRNYAHYRLVPITAIQSQKIVDKLAKGRSLPKQAAQETLRRLQDVHGFNLNPLLVTVFAATSEFEKQDVPPNITEIFKKFTELMLGRWDDRRGLEQQYQAPLKDFLLRKLAFAMHSARETCWTIEQCRGLFRSELEERGHGADLAVLFDEVIHRSGILRIDGDRIEFRHHLLQEFFAGRGIPDTAIISSVLGDDWWRTPIVFYFGDRPEDYQAIVHLLDQFKPSANEEHFEAGVTMGLAIQACYLVKTADKTRVLEWVLRSLAATTEACVQELMRHGGADRPLHAFLVCYMQGRDAVGCKQIEALTTRVFDEPSLPFDEPSELLRFWCLAGLIEAGSLARVQERLDTFRPEDRRLLLALHMGLILLANLRITDAPQKKIAEELSEKLGPRITDLIGQALNEFKGLLIELRQGKLQAVEPLPPELPPAEPEDSAGGHQ